MFGNSWVASGQAVNWGSTARLASMVDVFEDRSYILSKHFNQRMHLIKIPSLSVSRSTQDSAANVWACAFETMRSCCTLKWGSEDLT